MAQAQQQQQARQQQAQQGIELLLYDDPHSEYTAKVKVALHHKGLAFKTVLAKPCGGGSLDPEFLARAPLGKIPALVVRNITAAAAAAAAGEDQLAGPPAEPEEARLISCFHDLYLEPALLAR
ncbi:hypothetical protein OEZ85_013830 [Tetradesmus obliquus]|uniref:GST N-terminal domain-containing protein n=1 Tax=Tetradesmus obliquus TaxID=3088 RepID=A0ABY8U604_TETOB|nr:hypothetical protein OEZ85_013830 [Tetradesmus obliquus]